MVYSDDDGARLLDALIKDGWFNGLSFVPTKLEFTFFNEHHHVAIYPDVGGGPIPGGGYANVEDAVWHAVDLWRKAHGLKVGVNDLEVRRRESLTEVVASVLRTPGTVP